MVKNLPAIKAFLVSILLLVVHNKALAQCAIGFSGGAEPITLVDFANINNATPATGGTAYEDFTSMTANVLQGQTYTITVKGNTFGAYTDYIRVYADWNQNNDFTDVGESFNIGTINNSTGLDAVQASSTITIPVLSGLGTVRMRVIKKYNAYSLSCNTAGWGQAEDYSLNILSGSTCTGTPTPGTASAPSAICPNVSFNVSLTGYTAASGIGIQWEADAGSGWQPIFNATNAVYTEAAGITTNTSYRATVTCSNGGSSDVSNTVSVSVNLPTQCYCSISFPSTGAGPISYVNFSDISNTTASAVNSGQYEDFTAIIGNVMVGATYALTVKGNTVGNYSDYVRVFFDWDQNGSFNDPGESFDIGILTNTTGTDVIEVLANIPVPNTATLGYTRMRVTKKYSAYATACNTAGYGQAEDYSINVLAANSCIGMPTPGTASGPATICPNSGFNLSLTGYTVAAGIDLQWESNDGSGWQPISGANTGTYAIPGITVPTDYRVTVSCANGGNSDISNTVSVAVSPFTSCYCAPVNGGSTPINNITIVGTSLNNASGPAPTPNYYATYPATGATTATLMQGVMYDISATFGAAAIASLWVDFNQDGIFDAAEWTQITTNASNATASFLVPPTALTGLTGMRVRSRTTGSSNGSGDACTYLSSGETEDYFVTIDPAVACSGQPVPGTASGPSNICAGVPFVLTLTGNTIATGITIQWESNDGSGWQIIGGANSPTYSATSGIAVNTDFRAVVSCSLGGGQDISNTVSVMINAPAQCYCAISYPSGVEPITMVDFGGMNNTSSDLIGGSPGSEDFTAMTAMVNQGESYTITIKGNTDGPYTDYIRVFIDLDQNGILDDLGEVFNVGTITGSSGLDAVQATATIAIPMTAMVGTTRMRVNKKWNAYATACNNTGYGQAEDYSLFIDFPLQIKLTNIAAENTGSRNRINWSTASEAQGDYFELERSADGMHFQRLATIAAKGEAATYNYWDASPVQGINYYRLKMWEPSGKFAYSKTVTAVVSEGGTFNVAVYPNPITSTATLTTYGERGANAMIRVMDMTGRVVKTIDVLEGSTSVHMEDLASGSYLVEYSDDLRKEILKITKQ